MNNNVKEHEPNRIFFDYSSTIAHYAQDVKSCQEIGSVFRYLVLPYLLGMFCIMM
jgi:hypothetical protein